MMPQEKKLDALRGELVSRTKTPHFRAVHCQATRGLTKWCYALCRPVNGFGACGRPAYWQVQGRTQRAIAKYLAAQEEAARNPQGE